MWRKIGRVIGFFVGCGVILAYILYASHLAQEHRYAQCVERVIVAMADSTELSQFATSEQMYASLKMSGIKFDGRPIDSVDIVKMSNHIAQNGFVRDVDVYVTYAGELYVDIKQHRPMLRLLCGGIDTYVTEDYTLFRSPKGAACYTAVVTGDYRPRFPRHYEGNFLEYSAGSIEKENDRLRDLGRAFDSLRRQQSSCKSEIAKLKKRSRKSWWESKESYKQRLIGVKVEMKSCTDRLAALELGRNELKKRQALIENRKKKLQKNYDDFTNLINFVSHIKEDSFWGAEITQFVADTTTSGEIALRLVPRSGDFIIEFGTLEERKAKLAKLQRFYDKGLSRIGWEHYKTIDVRYDKQVICTK